MGPRLRDLRGERAMPQGEAARRLGVSPAYLSLIEKGKRQLQLPLLFRALELYGVAMEDFMSSLGERHVDDGLARLLDEPLFRSLNLTEDDLSGLSSEPKTITTVTALFNLYKSTRGQLDHVLTTLAERDRADLSSTELEIVPEADGSIPPARGSEILGFDYTPFDEVTDFLQKHFNWFPVLEDRADRFRAEAGIGERPTREELSRGLHSKFGVRVEALDPEGQTSVVRSWDAASNTLSLSAELSDQRARFQLAHTIGLRILEDEQLHRPIVLGYPARHTETPKLIKIHLANYFAGALMLPYEPFFKAVTRTRYDVDLLASIFDSTYETVAHRLCNLSDPRRRGVPFHFLRVDVGGNVSKRYSATGIPFPQGGLGSCPKLAVHMAFLTPSVLTRQYSVFPDGSQYFCFAKVVPEPKQGSLARGTIYSIGLGTNAQNAKFLAYADDLPFVDPKRMAIAVGSTCRFCERTDCNQRSAPSYKFAFHVDEHTKKDNFFSPIVQVRT